MGKSANKVTEQLGMTRGKASHILKNTLFFELIKEKGLNVCFQCSKTIDKKEEFSIEHKIPFLDSENPLELFFDLNNIAYSHRFCNTKAARKTRPLAHPSEQAYRYGCRCSECKLILSKKIAKQRANKVKH